jgi:4-amino-4-deoxy-L-arabinose transferase-like glycosyltransferase
MLGIIIILFFCFNPLILLHTRRAMAEGVLVFGLVLSLYAFLKLEKYPLLVGFTMAIAFNAKHSALVLLPIGLLAVSWPSYSNARSISRLISNTSQYLVGFTLLTSLLNPFIWQNPVAAAFEALDQRQSLLARQQKDFLEVSPAQVLETPTGRLAVMLAQMTVVPPIFAEVGNYREQTLLAESEYLRFPGNNWGRNYFTGGLILGFLLLGLLTLFRESFTGKQIGRRNSTIFLLSTSAMIAGFIFMIPLSWQRYSVPLIPFVSILVGVGLTWGIKNSRRIFSHGSLSSRLSQILAQFSTDSWMP